MNIYVHYGETCRRRFLDIKKISDYLKLNEYALVDNPDKADLIIIATCAVQDYYEDIAIKEIVKFKTKGKEIIVFGCLPSINKNRLREIHDGIVITTTDINKIEEVFKPHFVRFEDVDDYASCHDERIDRNVSLGRMKENLIIRASWGCLGNCSYCAIKFATGKFRSKPLEQCLKEFEMGIKKGYGKFIFEAEDLGAYGLDINKSFPELLEKILSFDGEFLLYLVNLNPVWMIKYQDELVKLFKSKHIYGVNITIESGSARILKKMNRYNKINLIKNVLTKLKNCNENIIFCFSIMVGFPGETEEDLNKTVEFLTDMEYGKNAVIINPYDDKPNTKSSKMSEKISSEKMLEKLIYMIKTLKAKNYTIYPEIYDVLNYILGKTLKF